MRAIARAAAVISAAGLLAARAAGQEGAFGSSYESPASTESARDVYDAKPEPGATPSTSKIAAAYKPGMGALIESLSTEPTDFNFKDADILGILRSFALRFEKNIIAAPGVSGRVNLHLKAVPFDEAFRTLLNQMGLVAVQKSANVIEIIRIREMPVLSQVFLLKYRFAQELAKTITEMLTPKERESTLIAFDPASNSLIVTSTNDMLQKVKSMVDALDIESPQIAIKARLIEVGMGDSLNTSAAWSGARKFDKGSEVGTARAILGMGNFQQNANTGALSQNQALTFFPTGGVFDFTAVLNQNTLYGLLAALKTDSRTKTISEPMILTGNNKSSKIHVGQQLPVKMLVVSQTSTVQEIRYIPEGVDLDVTPIVSPGRDVISITIRVGVSELIGFQEGAPITTERVATTEVSVQSGMTVVIGGLIKDKMTDVDAGIPILKSIPLLGYFFKTKRKSKEKTELLIFITPELLGRGKASSFGQTAYPR